MGAKKPKLKKRQKNILQVMKDQNGLASLKQIALLTGLSVNGISQSMGALHGRGLVTYLEGKGGEAIYTLATPTE